MAVMSAIDLAELRRLCAAQAVITTDKPTINAAIQAVEDYFENTTRAAMGAAIAGAWPGSTNAQKKAIVAYWMGQKLRREGF